MQRAWRSVGGDWWREYDHQQRGRACGDWKRRLGGIKRLAGVQLRVRKVRQQRTSSAGICSLDGRPRGTRWSLCWGWHELGWWHGAGAIWEGNVKQRRPNADARWRGRRDERRVGLCGVSEWWPEWKQWSTCFQLGIECCGKLGGRSHRLWCEYYRVQWKSGRKTWRWN